MLKTLIPFVQSPYQNWTDLGRLGGLDKGFYGINKNYVIVDYYSSHKKIKGLPYIERIINYCIKTENIEEILDTLFLIYSYGVKYIGMFETKIAALKALADSLLENLKDRENNCFYLHFELFKFKIAYLKMKDSTLELGIKLIDLINKSNIDLQCLLIMKLVIFSCTFDKEVLIKIEKDFQSIISCLEEDFQCQIYYINIGLFSYSLQALNNLGITIDTNIHIKILSIIKDQKETFVAFIAIIKTSKCLVDREHLITVLEYLDNLGVSKLNELRLLIRFFLISSNICPPDDLKIDECYKELQEFIDYLSANKDKFDYIEEILLRLYIPFLRESQGRLNIDSYFKYAEDFIELGIKNDEGRKEIICEIMESSIVLYLNNNQVEKANALSEKFVTYTNTFKNITKYDMTALKLCAKVKGKRKEYQIAAILAHRYAKLAEVVYSKNSEEYIDAVKEIALCYLRMNNINFAYKSALDAYELSKMLHDSEINVDCVDMLLMMANMKARLHQFDTAKSIITKCKGLEEKLSFKFSQRFKDIIELEHNVIKEEERINKILKDKRKKENFLSKFSPNTPSKLAICMAAFATTLIGVVYFTKHKK